MKIIAIIGSYRKGMFIDSIVEEALKPAKEQGAAVKKIYLTDAHIEFCNNCRECFNSPKELSLGNCHRNDEMKDILQEIHTADALLLASPINLGTVTAIMKRFIERCAMSAYWPWEGALSPVSRVKKSKKKSLVISSSAMPALMLYLLAPNILNVMRDVAGYLGFTRVKRQAFGLIGYRKNFSPTKGDLKRATKAGRWLCN